jgi:VWFA-related protein
VFRRTILGASLLACLCAVVSPAGQVSVAPSPPQTQPPTYRSGVDLITIDVTVLTRGGDPVTGLAKEDVSVTVDGRSRQVVSLQLVQRYVPATSPASTPSPLTATPPTTAPIDQVQRRRFLLVVDRNHIPAGEGQAFLEAAAAFVDQLPADDQVGLWVLPANGSNTLRLNEDRAALKARLRLAVGVSRPVGGLHVVLPAEALAIEEGVPGALGCVADRECRPDSSIASRAEACRREIASQASATIRETRDRAESTLLDVGGVIDALAVIEGPKDLVLVSGGIPSMLDNRSIILDLAQRAGSARVTAHAIELSRPSQTESTEMMASVSDCSAGRSSMLAVSANYMVAGATGGLGISPVSGVIGFNRLLHERSAWYVLTIETASTDRDGTVHSIDVNVKRAGWGGLVRARKSFRVAPSLATATPPPAPPGPAPTPSAPTLPPPDPLGTDPGDLADRLADYAEQFERDFSAVVAEEKSVQIIIPWRSIPPDPTKEPLLTWVEPGGKEPTPGFLIARRQMVSDVLMAQLKDQQWVAYRDVAILDGHPVRDRSNRVQDLFLSRASDKPAQFQRIAMESARYNLGSLKRDLNLPTVTLSFLRRGNQYRFEFKHQKDETLDGRMCRVLSYREKVSPTLVSTRNSGDVFIYGRVWLDQADGRVRRTELRFDRPDRSCVRVDYGPFEGVQTLVPVRMWEWHEGVAHLSARAGFTGLQNLATYSNYRRFSVSTSETIR